MFRAFVLVRNLHNLEPSTTRLDFGEFAVRFVGPEFERFRETFLSRDVDPGDWILEKSHIDLPPNSSVEDVRRDIEDILLLLRLSRHGDISFIRQAMTLPDGSTSVPAPSRVMNDLNSASHMQFEIRPYECVSLWAFADSLRKSQSWSSDWFVAARVFFLSGGAKPLKIERQEVDRIVDYVTALEAVLVPEKDYITSRISQRAAALIAPGDPGKQQTIVGFVKKLYEIRSRLVHGSRPSAENLGWLTANRESVELRARKVLVSALRQLPPGEEARRAALASLYDPTDEDRGNFALQKFKEIKTPETRRSIADRIAKVV